MIVWSVQLPAGRERDAATLVSGILRKGTAAAFKIRSAGRVGSPDLGELELSQSLPQTIPAGIAALFSA